MIMLHGLGGSSNFFQPLVIEYSKSYTVIRMDWEGLGRSKVDYSAPEPITLEKYVADITGLMEHFNLETAIIIGHSMGGGLGLKFSAENPSKVKALVVIGAGRSRAAVPAAKAAVLGLAKIAREKGMPAMADAIVARNVAPSSSDIVRAFVREVTAVQDKEGYARVCEAAMDKSHVDPDFSAITCPALVISGDQDEIFPEELGKEIATLIGGDREVGFISVHCGHQHVLEDPVGVIAAINTIL
jgi:pimeloyl-ACP methyl ester carboxylesterase